jgi:hypothetical protein
VSINANKLIISELPEILKLYTLFDITNTNMVRNIKGCQDSMINRNKQRNWETILQLLSLRTQPIIVNEPKCFKAENVAIYGLGDMYHGAQSVWYVEFSSEYVGVYGSDSISLLNSECEFVPMISGLDETAKFPQDCIITSGEYKNTSFFVNQN